MSRVRCSSWEYLQIDRYSKFEILDFFLRINKVFNKKSFKCY